MTTPSNPLSLFFNNNGQATIYNTATSISTNTGALTVYGGMGIGGNLAVGGYTYYNSLKTAHIYIKGTGLNNGGSNLFAVNGVTISSNINRGLTFITIDKATLTPTVVGSYDTYGTATSSTQLAALLNGMTNTQIGVLMSYDAIEAQINSTLINALISKGLYKLAYGDHTGSRRPYAAIFDATGTANPSRNVMEVWESSNAAAPQAVIATYIATDGTTQGAGFQGNDLTNVLVSGQPDTATPVVIVDQGGGVTIGGLTTVTNNLVVTGGVVSLQNGTSNWINFGGTGVNAPIAGRSTGTKLILYDNGGPDYAIGIESYNMWFGVPANGPSGFKWYLGSTATMLLNSSGVLTLNGTTQATSTTTGALVVAGGIGVNGQIYAGSSATILVNSNTGPLQGSHLTLSATTGTQQSIGFVFNGTPKASMRVDSGGTFLLNSANNAFGFSFDLSSPTQPVTFSTQVGGGGVFLQAFGTTATIMGTWTAISTSSGALQVRGGIGVAGNVYAGQGISSVGTSSFISPNTSATITARMLNTDILTFSGARGQLFSISDSFTGTIFGVYDVSGIPSIEVYDTGNVVLAETFGNVGIGVVTSATTSKFTVGGGVSISGITTITNTTQSISTNSGALQVQGGAGIWQNLYVGGTIYSNGYALGTGTAVSLVNNTNGTAVQYLTFVSTSTGTVTSLQTAATSGLAYQPSTGNLTVGGGLYVGSTVTATNVYGVSEVAVGTGNYVSLGGQSSGTRLRRDASNNGMDLQTNSLSRLFIADTDGAVTVRSVTVSTSTNTGALLVAGGVGIGGAVYINTTSYIAGAQILTTATLATFSPGVSSIIAGTDTAVSSSTGVVTIWDTSTLQSVTGRGATTNNQVTFNNGATFGNTANYPIQLGGVASNAQGTLILANGTVAPPASSNVAYFFNGQHAVTPSTATISSYYGLLFLPTLYNGTNYNSMNGVFSRLDMSSAAATGTVQVWTGYTSATPTRNTGATGTIVTHYGFVANDPNTGTTQVGFFSQLNSSAGLVKWNIYSSGSAPNFFQGQIQYATTITTTNVTAATITAALTRGADGNFQLTAQNGPTNNNTGAEVARLGINYAGSGWDTFFQFNRGSGAQNGAISIQTAAGTAIAFNQANTAATATTTGTLVVTGGVGVSGSIYSGGTNWINYNSGDNQIRAQGLTVSYSPGSNFVPGSDPTDSLRNTALISSGTSTRPVVLTFRNTLANSQSMWDFVSDPNTSKFYIQPTNAGYYAMSLSTTGTVFINTNSNSISTTTGALTVQGGLGVGGNLFATSITVAGTTQSTSTNTGAFVVGGGIGVGGNVNINGSLNAITKSFLINHPTKPGMRLRYGSLEGPENGVYIRGRLTGTTTIQLPDYWTKLVDPDSITVQLTPIGKHQKLYVEAIKDNTVIVENDAMFGGSIDCYYVIFAERADTDKLEVEMPG
jgi:hypothetical protein